MSLSGVFRNIISEEQRENAIVALRNYPLPCQYKLQPPCPPKTAKQLRYAHSLCNALSAYHNAHPDVGKKDAKVAFGVIVVSTSLITSERTARLTSFADYSKEQMEAFLTAMEEFLSRSGIPFTPTGD